MKDYKLYSNNVRVFSPSENLPALPRQNPVSRVSIGMLLSESRVSLGVLLLLAVGAWLSLSFFVSGLPDDPQELGNIFATREMRTAANKIAEDLERINQVPVFTPESRVESTVGSSLDFMFYKVQGGESIYSIAKKYGVSMDTLLSMNSMDDAHRLSAGQQILVPNQSGILYTVNVTDTLEAISEKYDIDKEAILAKNHIDSERLKAGQTLFLPNARFTAKEREQIFGYFFTKPVHGRITSYFGYRRHPILGRRIFHDGLDIAAPMGTSVRAIREGRVVFAGWNGGYGYEIMLRHQFGYTSVYAHLSRIHVRVGQYVQKGQRIGRIGSTGRSTGPHLHLEVHKYNRRLNPLRLQGLGVTSRGRF